MFKFRGSRKVTAEKIYRTLEDILAGRARTPVQLRDDGRGETLETYQVGLARVRIAVENGWGLYMIQEPPLSPEEELLYAHTLQKIVFELRPEEAKSVEEAVGKMLEEAVGELDLEDVNMEAVRYYLNREVFGYGRIDVILRDEEIEDLKCTGVGTPIIVKHRKYGALGWLESNVAWEKDEELDDFVRMLAHRGGRGISIAIPYADAQLPPPVKGVGMRFAGTMGREITAKGSTFTIRKFPSEPLSITDLIRGKTLSTLMAAYLWFVAENKRLFFAAGPTGSGKSTLLNAILGLLDPRLSYITIEDVYELQLPADKGWIPMTTRRSWSIVEDKYEVKLEDLIAMAMRMRPDYLIVGEVRTPEHLLALLLSSTTGHGAMTTFHAPDPNHLLVRLLTMKIQRSALDLLWGCAITQEIKGRAGLRIARRVVRVAEFVPAERGVEIVDVFAWNPEDDSFKPQDVDELWDLSPRLRMVSEALGVSRETILGDIAAKASFLEENADAGFYELASRAAAIYTEKTLRKVRTRG